MTLTMSLLQSGKLIHSDNEWWWPLYHIAPVLAKGGMIKHLSRMGGPSSPAIPVSVTHTEEQRILSYFKKQVVGRCWTWLKLLQCLKWLPPKFDPLSGYTWHLCLSKFHMITFLWTWGLFSNTKSVSMIFILTKALLYFILARILESYVLFWSPCCRRCRLARDGLKNNKMIKMIDSFICSEKWKKTGSFCLWKGKQFLPSKKVFPPPTTLKEINPWSI